MFCVILAVMSGWRTAAWLTLSLLMLHSAAAGANYFYDNAGRLTKVDYGEGGVVSYAYDAVGNLISRQVQPAATIAASSPVITSVTNAQSGSRTIAPNTWVAIYGTNLTPAGASRVWAAADFAAGVLPTQLDNIGVTVNGKSAFVYYISPTQVNILTPPDPMQGQVNVQLNNGGLASGSFSVQAQPVSLAFFVFDKGYVCAVHADGSLIGPTSLYPGKSTPAKSGEIVLLFANGLGVTNQPVTSASLAQSGNLPTLPVITIGGITAEVTFAGLISPGLYQLNVVMPSGSDNGDTSVTLTYRGLTTQAGLFLTVQK
jgi:uncharacterized protein (TIGR03437 family)